MDGIRRLSTCRTAFSNVRPRPALLCHASRYLAIALAAALSTSAYAQNSTRVADPERNATVIVTATVLETHKSAEDLQPASSRTVVVKIKRMEAGTEIAGDQAGRLATIVLSPSAPKIATGQELRVFGNVRFIGKGLTIEDTSEQVMSGDASAAKASLGPKDRALVALLAGASAVFVGKVEEVHSLPDSKVVAAVAAKPEPASEHDPMWRVASVRVLEPIKGAEKGALVNVLFSASRDVVWINSPKLSVSQETLLITHNSEASGAPLTQDPSVKEYLARVPAHVVDRPLESISNEELVHVRDLLTREEKR